MDRLAIAARATLEANLKQSAPPTVMAMIAATLLHASEKEDQPQPQKPMLSDFATNADDLAVLGPKDEQLIA